MDLKNAAQAELHLAILGSRQSYQITAKNYTTKEVKNDFLRKDEVITILTNLNEKGYTTWVSINDKEKDCIEGVKALCDFWIDIDARPKGIDDRPATQDEKNAALDKAEKLKNYLLATYNAEGFLAASGNGFHIHYPLPRFELSPELRTLVNKRVRAFAKTIAKQAKIEIDATYDISRKTTLIGTKNKKIPTAPLDTVWDREIFREGLEVARQWVDTARIKNQQLLDTILATPAENPKKAVLPTEKHVDIEELLRLDRKLYKLYKEGDYSGYTRKDGTLWTRSEAEQSVLVTFAMEGFSDDEINTLMENCALGKWQERNDNYRVLSLQHAREQATQCITEKKETKKLCDETEVNPILLAKETMEKYAFVLEDVSDNLYFFEEKEGVYSNKTERLLKREIAKVLDEETRLRYYAEVENWIKSTADIRMIDENPNLLAVQNGVLDVRTRELKPFTKDLFITRKLQWKYDKEAKCPKIDAFKLRILPEENKRLLAQEYEGYCLFGDLIYKKAYIANGNTDTGKTVHQNILTALIGEENLSHQTIQALNHVRFSPAELFGKMGNFVDDLPSSIVKTTGFFKMALGHGTIPAERKGKDPFNFKNKAKFWINANDLPPVAKWEDTDAYFNRLLINDYEVQIPVAEQNSNLIYELTTPEEMSGYLNQALDGLDRLLKNKQFTYAKTQGENRIIYTKRSDAAKWFAETYIQITDEYNDFIFHDDLFHNCVKICHQEQLKKIPSSGELTKAIQVNCLGAHYTKIRKVIGYDAVKEKDIVRLEPAWRYTKIVPNVPNVQPISNPSAKSQTKSVEKSLEKYVENERGRTNGTNGTKEENLIASHCLKWRTGACSFPGDPNCVVPTNPCPKTCSGYEEQEAAA
jgi:putative DNA primase/helicase